MKLSFKTVLPLAMCLIVPMELSAEVRNCSVSGDYTLRPVWHLSEHQNAGDFDPGDYEHVVDGTVSIKCDDDYTFEVPSGEVFNGFSIPRAAWSIFDTTPLAGKVLRPGIIHDYQVANRVETSDFVHGLLFDAMIAEGVDPNQASKFFAAVLNFGPQWSEPGGAVTIPTFRSGFLSYLMYTIDQKMIPQRTDEGFALTFDSQKFNSANIKASVEQLSKEAQAFSMSDLNAIEEQVQTLQTLSNQRSLTEGYLSGKSAFEFQQMLNSIEGMQDYSVQ